MPGGDRTGPLGMGPMTGRDAGFCAGFAMPGFMNSWGAYGMGFGRGRGFRRMYGLAGFPAWKRFGYSTYDGAYMPAVPAVDEKELLSKQAEFLENQLQLVKKRLKAFAGDAE